MDLESNSELDHANAMDRARAEIKRLTAELDGEREARHKTDAALRMKEDAMQVLFDRLRTAGVDFSDLIP